LTFCIAESLQIAKITFQNSHDYDYVLKRLSENPIIDGERTRIALDRKKPYAFYIKNLNPLTDEYLLHNYVIGDLSTPKVVVHREIVEESREKSFEEKRHLFLNLFSKYLNKEELDNLYLRFANSNRNHNIKHAFITLPSREIAEKIVNDLDGKVGLLGTQRLRAKILSNTTIKVDKQVFTVMNWLIHKKAQEISETYFDIKITIDRPQDIKKNINFYKIRVVSSNNKLNRAVTAQFERLVKGEEFYGITAEDSIKLMDSSMKEYFGKLQTAIDTEYKEYGRVIHISVDTKMKRLVLYSPLSEAIEKARKAIQNTLDREIKLECIDLRNYNIKSVKEMIARDDTNFPTLETAHGKEESSSIDLDYLNKKAYIRADKESIEIFKEKIKDFLVQNHHSTESCPICFEELSDDCCFLYNCGHKLCKSDFIQCVESQHGKSFVTCPYPECGKIISLKDIKEAMPIDKINNIVDRHVRSFIQVNNQIYRNCPTPDCNYIYLKKNQVHKCEGCMESYCVKNPDDIHEYHEHENCEALKFRDDAQKEFEKLVEQGKVKITKCCNIPMTRSEGCSHMVCTQCGKHFCWLCLQVCSSAEETYLHIEECSMKNQPHPQEEINQSEGEDYDDDDLKLDSDSDLELD